LFAVSPLPPYNIPFVVAGSNPPARLSNFSSPDIWKASSLTAWQNGVLMGLHDHGGKLAAYDLASSRPSLEMIFDARITALSAPPGESWLAAGTDTGSILILDAKTLTTLAERTLWTAAVRTLATSPQGLVVAGANDGKLALIELES
jgi:WD40 repeat protein